jgi:hypothetical protein
MFIRFTILKADADTKKKTGVLVAAHTLRDEGDLSVEEHRRLRVCLAWFNKNLHIPSTYKDLQNKRALSWFKPAATECIDRMWELKQILDDHGLHVEVLKTRMPGTIVYEDGWQVIAIPRNGQRFQ